MWREPRSNAASLLLAPPPGPTPGWASSSREFKLVLLRRRPGPSISSSRRGRAARLDRHRKRVSLLDRLRSPRPSARHALVHARSAEHLERAAAKSSCELSTAARDDGVPGGAGHPHRDGRVGVLVRGVHARGARRRLRHDFRRGLGAAPAFLNAAHRASLNLAPFCRPPPLTYPETPCKSYPPSTMSSSASATVYSRRSCCPRASPTGEPPSALARSLFLRAESEERLFDRLDLPVDQPSRRSLSIARLIGASQQPPRGALASGAE